MFKQLQLIGFFSEMEIIKVKKLWWGKNAYNEEFNQGTVGFERTNIVCEKCLPFNNKNPATNLIFKRAKDRKTSYQKTYMHGINTQEKMF